MSILSTLIITIIIIALIGGDPILVFNLIFEEVISHGYGIGQVLFKATPLIICGCGLALCFHASLFNIGAEGQLNIGSFVMAVSGVYLSHLPFPLFFILLLIIGFISSSLWGLLPAIIKIKKGVSEVISTIMMNFIAMALINYFLIEYFAVKSTVRTEKLPDHLLISKFSDFTSFFEGSSLNLTFFFAIAIAVLSYLFIYKTNLGYKIRAFGFNEIASKYLGIKNNFIVYFSFLVGAGLTSFVGINFVLGYKGYYEYGFSNNLGFTAIAVTLLAKNNPIGIIFTSLLFGFLDFSGLTVNNIIPKEIMFVVQGLIILAILSIDKVVNYYYSSKL